MTDKNKADQYAKILSHDYQPNKAELESDVSVPVSPDRLVRAVVEGSTLRREKKAVE